jgi:hypothetical protein
MSARSLLFRVAFGIVCVGYTLGQTHPIDVARSTLIVHVSKTGLFSAFADNHVVAAPISGGVVDAANRRVQLIVKAGEIRVLDPQLSPDKRQQVQERMLGPDVLDAGRFPQISFESTSIDEAEGGHFIVHGLLSLHGVTRPVVVNVTSESGGYVGSAAIKQRDFGIPPIAIAAGTVKVKNELQIDFNIRISK